MTRIKRMIFISTAIILCILTVMTASCTYVYTRADDVRSTRFFAVPLSAAIKAFPEPSLSSPKKETVISWLRRDEFIFDREDMYKLSSSVGTGDHSLKAVFKADIKDTDLYILSKNTSYYMRI